jgi:hypothetical protein
MGDPFDRYKISDVDDAADPKYYGFVDSVGHWYIQREDTALKQYRYARGRKNYATAWAGRAALDYDLFSVVWT